MTVNEWEPGVDCIFCKHTFGQAAAFFVTWVNEKFEKCPGAGKVHRAPPRPGSPAVQQVSRVKQGPRMKAVQCHTI